MKKLLALILAAVMILGLAACNNEPKPTEPTGQGSTTAPTQKPGETTAPTSGTEPVGSSEEQPAGPKNPERYGGDMAYNWQPGLADVLDPNKKTGNTVYCWSFYCFENPLAIDGNGETSARVCNFEYDQATATLKLWPRENTFFSNGDPVDIYDVYASVDRCIHIVKNPMTHILKKLVKDPEIITDTDGIQKIVYVWPEHATTNLQYIQAYQPWMAIMPREICEKYGYDETIKDPADCIGTGPYKVVEFNPGVSITLERNEYYVPFESGKTGLAGPVYNYFDKIVVYGGIDDNTVAMMMASGEIDWDNTSISEEQYNVMLEPLGFQKVSIETSGFNQTLLMFNMMNEAMPVANNADLRKAITAAINVGDLETYRAFNGNIPTADTELMISNTFSTKDLAKADYYQGGPAVAKQYLIKSGYDTSRPLKFLLHGGSPEAEDLIIQSSLAVIGLQVEFISITGMTEVDEYYVNAATYDYDFTWATPAAAFYVPTNLVANIKDRFWKSEKKDELLATLGKEPVGSAASEKAWKEFLDLWIEDCAVFPVLRHNSPDYANPDLELLGIDQGNCRINSYWKANKEDHRH